MLAHFRQNSLATYNLIVRVLQTFAQAAKVLVAEVQTSVHFCKAFFGAALFLAHLLVASTQIFHSVLHLGDLRLGSPQGPLRTLQRLGVLDSPGY
eukprot:Skav235301  [mRNA]  locus=scaffold520:84469:92809:+ [translate_table: standard]